jgi:tetratricopeptide (TPR) repeat protein
VTRFDLLEFDDGEPVRKPAAPEIAADHDEHHWLRAADAERREGFFENALRFYSRALEINRTIVPGWVGQVQMLIALGEFVEAELWARKALELFRNNGDLIAGRAHALARLANLREALPLSDASFKQEGQGAYRWMVRGEIMLAQRENVDAHCFDKAVQLDSDWLVLVEIAQIYRYRRKPSSGLMLARKAVERMPTSVYCWYVQGLCEIEMGVSSSALRSFDRCLELKPGHLEARRARISLEADQWSISSRLKRFFRLK